MSGKMETDEFAERLGVFVRQFCAVDDQCLRLCAEHYAKLQQWNKAMNLVGDSAVDTVVARHYGEGLYLATLLPSALLTVGDFGSGGGFPGICVAAHRRNLSVKLLESRSKKSAFLEESTRGWNNVEVFCGEAERYPSTIDCWVSRGVRAEAVLRCANSRDPQFQAALLLSAQDAAIVADSVMADNRTCRIELLPWRKESAVVLIDSAQV